MGIYIFSRTLMNDLLLNKHPDAKDFGKEIIPSSIAHHKVVSYQYDGYWTDIGNIYSFFEANLALTSDVPVFNLFDSSRPSIYACTHAATRQNKWYHTGKNHDSGRMHHPCQPYRKYIDGYPLKGWAWQYYREQLFDGK
jgi:ADP-glucose pyrophosphorylase